MNDYELQFLIMVETDIELGLLFSKLIDDLPDSHRESSWSFRWKGNICMILLNEDHDVNELNGEDGYLYYKFRIELSPIKDCTIEEQISMAKYLEKYLSSFAEEVAICADFEELL